MDIELLHKYFRGETTTDEELEIIDWVESSLENKKEYLNERKIWNALLLQSTSKQNKHPRILQLYHFARYAAAIILIVSISIFTVYKLQPEQEVTLADVSEPTLILKGTDKIDLTEESFSMKDKLNTINNNRKKNQLTYQNSAKKETKVKVRTHKLLVPHGKTYQLILPDSTEVILNAETELEYPSSFKGKTREVKLVGEAYFKVKRNEEKPFIVHTSELDVCVLGTSFNVSSYPQEENSRTTLVEGSIQVELEGKKHLISPSEQFVFNKKTKSENIQIVNTDVYTAWANNEYIFENTSLEEIMYRLGHWYKFSVQFDSETLKDKRFTFSITRDASLDQIIKLINNTREINIERNNNSIFIKQNL